MTVTECHSVTEKMFETFIKAVTWERHYCNTRDSLISVFWQKLFRFFRDIEDDNFPAKSIWYNRHFAQGEKNEIEEND